MKNSRTILLGEDNEDDLFLSQRVLSKAGIAPVFHVWDGKDLMDYLAGQGAYTDRVRYPLPDVVLLDLKMPAYTGHEVLDWVRSQPALRELKVYVLTSSNEACDRQRVEKAGIQGYLVKPLSLEHLTQIFGT